MDPILLKWLRAHWDRVGGAAAMFVGGLMLLVSWVGTSRTAYPAGQIPYLVSGGLGGLFMLGIGATLWISADVRDEWRKLDEIAAELRAGRASELTLPGRTASPHCVVPDRAESTVAGR
ncbi:MAG: hypothetical protein QOI86_3802 [Actinomycetota bacterium]|jgi:hypothetical protein|nr:hypothetical protein [Actinomycetota bacterium]